MKHTHIFLLCVFILGCGRINTSPEFFKPDEKCYVVVESSLSLNEKLKELLKEALQDKKNRIENQNLEYEENNDSTQEGPGKFTYSVGTFTYNSGDKYEGEWKDGMRSGQGTQTYPDGGKYEGSWKKGVRWDGTSYDKDGKIYKKYVNGKWIKQ